MTKIKMLFRFHGELGKMEQGLEYSLPSDYAVELIKAGLAEPVIAEMPVVEKVREIGRVRSASGRFKPRS